ESERIPGRGHTIEREQRFERAQMNLQLGNVSPAPTDFVGRFSASGNDYEAHAIRSFAGFPSPDSAGQSLRGQSARCPKIEEVVLFQDEAETPNEKASCARESEERQAVPRATKALKGVQEIAVWEHIPLKRGVTDREPFSRAPAGKNRVGPRLELVL